MAVPKRRKSSSKRDMRRSQHDKIVPKQYDTCTNCGEVTLPHRACAACGFVVFVPRAIHASTHRSLLSNGLLTTHSYQ